MKSKSQKPKHALDSAVDEVRNLRPDPADIEGAGARVWARISEEAAEQTVLSPDMRRPEVEAIRGCGDYQSLIPTYLAGQLSPARTLLLEDHSSECISCRKALTAARSSAPSTSGARRESRGGLLPWQWVGVGLAAALMLALGLGQSDLIRLMLFPIEIQASAQTVRGQLFLLDGPGLMPISAGAQITAGEPIRTATNSGAILELADGTRVEMRERSQMTFVPASDGVRVQLERGSVIVRAAEQRDGHLYVSTDDVDVSVVGTVFAVSEGTKGSRVSVIEGEVNVRNEATAMALFPGEQFNSSQALTQVPIEQEIAWSQELALHIALLGEFAGARDELRDAIASQGLRYSSTLLGRVPADTVMYAAFPNAARTLTDAYDVFRRRIEENAVIRQWWNESAEQAADSGNLTVDQMIEQVRALSSLVGNEVVLAMAGGIDRPEPLLLAEITDAEQAVILLRAALAMSSEPVGLEIVTAAADLGALAGTEEAIAYVEGGLLAFSPSPGVIMGALNPDGSFSGTEFYASLSAAYADGIDWLFGADIDQLLDGEIADLPDAIGLNDLNDLIVDYKALGASGATSAIMNFEGSRTGVASWIGPAAPMGGLDFISPDTLGVVAGLTRDPVSIVGEVFDMLRTEDTEEWNEILAFQAEHRIDIQYDLASPLGGEIAITIDGPMLPTPAWKVVIEVYDSARLQNTLERLGAELNRAADLEGKPGVRMTAESVGGQVYHTLILLETGSEIHYTYAGGYMIVAPGRALVTQALQYNQTRYTLGNSAAFQGLLPAGTANYCSAILYQNMTPMISAVADYIPLPDDAITGDQLATIEETVRNTPPTLVCVAAEEDRIVASNQGELAFNLVTLGGFSGLLETLSQVQGSDE